MIDAAIVSKILAKEYWHNVSERIAKDTI